MFLTTSSSAADKLSKSKPVALSNAVNAALSGANTVKGPGPCSVDTKFVASRAAAKEVQRPRQQQSLLVLHFRCCHRHHYMTLIRLPVKKSEAF